MEEIFIEAIRKLTTPLAIIAIVQLFVIVVLVLAMVRHLPALNRTVGGFASLLERIFYDTNRRNNGGE
jgi:hypothetical protein